jgi:hypothetical protein
VEVPVEWRIVAEKVEKHLEVDEYAGHGESHE